MRKVESTGKSVDEAIYNGLVKLGLSIDEVDIEIINQGSRGIFGLGGTKATVALTEKESVSLVDEIFRKDAEEESKDSAKEPVKQHRESQGPPRRNENPSVKPGEQPTERPRRDDRRGGSKGGRDRRTGKGNGRSRGERSERKPQEPIQVNLGEKIDGGKEQEFLEGILSRMGMGETHVDSYRCDDNCVSLTLSGPSMGVLIGRRGETLNALQYVVSLYANKGEEDYKRFVVDTENYRIKREATLRKLARKKAQEAKSSGESVSLEPMNPYERRVLHSELQSFAGVTTHSEGEEPNRHVVIKPN